jgi:hypothetical protein
MSKRLTVVLALWMIEIYSALIPSSNANPLVADAFDYPVGPPNGDGYHIQQAFEKFGQVYFILDAISPYCHLV